MDTFRKWLNKPKADDKSLLARFYHADRSLTAVASELDSFDGRAEPDRCSRLVGRLRQGQDKVLAITNQIMEELLGEDREPRAFRAKFPEEVLQENLAGQLWFGAECLAAGSSIMNREEESKEMRPLAQAVTKSLDTVRNLLRDQCLRNNVPNSKTLHLDLNDSATEQLYESLKIFDHLFAEFELRYVSAMVQVKSKEEYEMQELICVLFSETLQRALKIGLIEQEKVDIFDPALMFSIPRLAIIAGLIVYPKGPLNIDMPADQLSEMFRPFRMILIKIRDLLRTLSKNDLNQLEKLLCTTEDHTKIPLGTSSIEAPTIIEESNNNIENSTKIENNSANPTKVLQNTQENPATTTTTNVNNNNSNNNTISIETENSYSTNGRTRIPYERTNSYKIDYAGSITSLSVDNSTHSTPASSPAQSPTPSHSMVSTSSVTTETTNSPIEWSDDEEDDDDDEDDVEDNVFNMENDNQQVPSIDIVSADFASGYLIPNTNFGNLFQPQDAPLTDNFIANDIEASEEDDLEERPSTSAAISAARNHLNRLHLNPSFNEQNNQNETINSNNNNIINENDNKETANRDTDVNKKLPPSSPNSCSNSNSSRRSSCNSPLDNSSSTDLINSNKSHRPHRHHYHHHHHKHNHHHHHHHHHHRRSSHHKAKHCTSVDCVKTTSEKTGSEATVIQHETSSVDSNISSSSSEGDAKQDVALAVRSANRLKFRSTDSLLHRLFVCIAGVADQLQTNFASDLRHILRSVFLMNMSSAQDDIDIPEKPKDSELFEFRASENDVIQESAGSNQSIYSAEEVNPESDNVFNNTTSNIRNNERHSTGAIMQRNSTIDMGMGNGDTSSSPSNNSNSTNRMHIGRTRSLGDQDNHEATTNHYNRCLASSNSNQRFRNNSVGSNISSSSSSLESNSPPTSENRSSSRRFNNSTSSSNNNLSNSNQMSTSASSNTLLSPPAWIPDGRAPRCMSCQTPFTAFRRRHHCRNCGGVFCGACSNASAPLPKYGLTKAVRVCRECYVREVRASPVSSNSAPQQHVRTMTTAGGS